MCQVKKKYLKTKENYLAPIKATRDPGCKAPRTTKSKRESSSVKCLASRERILTLRAMHSTSARASVNTIIENSFKRWLVAFGVRRCYVDAQIPPGERRSDGAITATARSGQRQKGDLHYNNNQSMYSLHVSKS